MAYKKLLLVNQGGIVDEIHRSEQDNCAVVAIGLGGTGISCLKNLKAKIFNRVIPDSADSAIPTYNHVKFLALDSDSTGFRQSNDLSCSIDKINMDTEYFDISYSGDINELFEQSGDMLDQQGEYKEWLKHRQIHVESAETGACGVRQIGRYLLMQKANEFVSKVGELISDAKKGLTNPKVYIHIFSGLGGGTGAGTFLDVCYLVQKALSSEGANAFVCGYFFLPDVNLSNNPNAQTKKNIKINGYASLQELDYCMNFKTNGDKWSQRYKGVGLVETQKSPVNICHLVSGRTAKGDIIPNAYEYAMNVVTDYFMDFLVKTTEDFTLKSHIANYEAVKQQVNKDSGAQYEYCVLGASNAALPYKEVLTYLSSYLFGYMAKMNKNTAGNSDCDAFVKANGLGYESLFNMVMNGVDISFPEPDNRPRDAHENDDLVTTYFADLRSNAVGVAERNINQMKREIENYDTANAGGNSGHGKGNSHASSIITKIFNALNNIVVDPDKGPYFASSLINGTSGNDLVAYVNGHIETINSRISQLEFNLPKAEQQRKLKQDNFLGSGHVSGRRYREYVAATKEVIRQYTQQQIYYAFRDFLSTLRTQIVELSTKYYRVYSTVITNLNETFIANKEYLENIADNVANYEYPIATIKDLKETLDNYLRENFDVPSQMKVFHQYMLTADGYKAWKDNKENDISKYVSDYFSSIFKEYTNKGMTQYLQEKYGTDNTDTLIQNIRDDIMNILDSKAEPLYWTSSLYTSNDAAKIGYTSVPNTSAEVEEAAKGLEIAKKELKVRKADVKDRITIMRCYVGAPLYGYQPLCQYEDMSLMGDAHGKHLYEGKEYVNENGLTVKGRDWRYLPSPTPLSKMNDNNSKALRDLASKRKELYVKAEQLEIIVQPSPNEYVVRVIDESFMNEISDIAEKAKVSKDNVSLYNACEKIKNLKLNIRYSNTKFEIPNDANNGAGSVPESEKKIVRIDHFASMPVICDIVEKEIEKLNKIDELIVSLEPKIDTNFEDYAMALFTGAIKIVGVQVIYVDDFGMDVQLSAPIMPMGGIRLYQAYKNFKSLDENTRKKLKNIVDERNNMAIPAAETIEGCRNMTAQLNPQVKLQQLQVAKTRFVAEANDILIFFDDLTNKLDEYIMTYGINL